MKRNPPDTLGTTRAMMAPRYLGIPTFMRTPLIEDPALFDIAMVGVPYDGAVTNRPGARFGPREIRNASSMMRAIHPVSRVNPYELCRIGDAGDVPFTRVYEVEAAHRDITRFISRLHAAGVIPITAGGDHSITLAIFRALAADAPIGMIQIDAHTDTWDEFMGSTFTHGAPFRRAVEEGLLDPERTVQIGIRGAQNHSASRICRSSSGAATPSNSSADETAMTPAATGATTRRKKRWLSYADRTIPSPASDPERSSRTAT